MLKARLHFDGDNVGIEKLAREYSLTQDVENKLNSIPEVIDNVTTDSGTDALSARMGMRLQEQIDNLASRGRYLTTWNAETGLPDTNPQVSPYVYRAGDYYIVGNVSSGTNYRPHGSSYTSGVASQTVEPESLSVNDLYIYDGTQWVLQGGGGTHSTVWGSISGTLSNQTDLQNALDEKLNFGDNLAFNDTTTVLVGRGVHSPGGDSCGHWVTIDPKGEVFTHNATTGGYNETTLGNGEIEILHSVSSTSTDYTVTIDHEKLTVNDGINTQIYSFLGSNRIATLNDITAHTIPELHTSNVYYDLITTTPGTYKLVDSGKYLGYTYMIPSGVGYVEKPAGGNFTTGGNGILYFKGEVDWTYIEGGTIIRSDMRYVQGGTGSNGYEFIRLAPMAGFSAPVGPYRGQLWYDISADKLKVYDDSNNWVLVDTDEVVVSTTAPSNPTLGLLWYDSTNNVLKAYDGTNWNACGGGSAYSAGNGININANNEISVDTTVVATQTDLASKANAADIELKVFTLSSTSDVTTGAEIVAWCNSGKIAVIKYGDDCYYLDSIFRGEYTFKCPPSLTAANTSLFTITIVDNSGTITISGPTASGYTPVTTTGDHSLFGRIDFTNYSPTVPSKTTAATNTGNALATEAQVYLKADASDVLAKNNTTSYTPSGDYNPATKKYVDDNDTYIGTSAPTNNLVEGRLWYDTTNDVLKVYDGTNWNNVDTDTTYSAGNGINIDANNEISVDTSVVATQTDIANFFDKTSDDADDIDDTNSTNKFVTDTEKNTWNGKQDAIQDLSTIRSNAAAGAGAATTISGYGDIVTHDANEFATAAQGAKADTALQSGDDVSELVNDAGYITNAVNDLANYYKKTETYTQAEINSLISNFGGFEVVSTLPVSDIKTNIIYLLGPTGTGADKYEEYIYYNSTWTKIGDTSVDLTNYFNTSTQTSDAITQGSTNLFLTSAERTKLNNTSGVNSGDETKSSIQTALGAATSSNSGYLTSTDWATFNGKANASDINTKMFKHIGSNGFSNAEIQEAVDYIITSGKLPILVRDVPNVEYIAYSPTEWVRSGNDRYIKWESAGTNSYEDGCHYLTKNIIQANLNSSNQVTSVNHSSETIGEYLDTDYNYSTPYTPLYDGSPATKKYVDDSIVTYTAGTNISIDANNEISATDTIYNAGEGIEILNMRDYSALQGPAPDGFHVPLTTEWQAVKNIRTALGGGSSDGTNFGIALKLPFVGRRSLSTASVSYQGMLGYYWSSSPYPSSADSSYYLNFYSSNVIPQDSLNRAYGFPVRCFKNSPTVPTSSWTKLYGTSIEAGGIFWSSADGLISLSSDGNTWITIADKNLGATTVWNSGDTVSESNSGGYFQWGNNYMFPFTGSVTASSTQVDASNYGPGNYYNSDTFITGSSDWSNVQNDNLWGGETGVVTLNNAITNTGVLSVNGQTGDVTIQTGGTYTAGDGIDIDANNVISVDSAYMSGYIPRSSGIHPDNLANSVLYYGEYLNGGVTTSLGLASDQVGVRTDIDQQNRNRAYLEYYNGAVDLYLSDTVSGANTTAIYKSTGIESTAGGPTETFEFQGTGNDKIARLKDVPSYTAGNGISIDANNEISVDNTIARVTDVNTKTFYLSSTSDLTNAQAAVDWYLAGGNPILIYDKGSYILNFYSSTYAFFYLAGDGSDNGNSYTEIKRRNIRFDISNNTVTTITNNYSNTANVLVTNYDYSTPYTPLYNGSPATKKYVDDNVVQKSATAPSSPTEGMVWYDTTNDVLKVYDGTNWNEVGGGSGDMLYADFNWASKTGATVTLDLNSTITPSANFTVNAPSTIKDGQMYVLRVTQGATAYTMTLGTNVTNPYGESLTMSAYTVNQFSFLAVGGNLELQPSVTVGESGAKIFCANTGSTGHEISDIGGELETWLNATGQTDDYDTFKDAVLVYDGVTYNRRNTFYTDSGYKYIYFISRSPNVQNNNNGTSKGYYSLIRFKFSYNSGWFYEHDYSTSYVTTTTQNFLRTDYNYPTPYTPLYNGSPATKKYVDDSIVTYTAGNGISIDANNEISASVYRAHQPGTVDTIKIWLGSQTDYDKLSSYDSGTLYFTTSS